MTLPTEQLEFRLAKPRGGNGSRPPPSRGIFPDKLIPKN